MGRGGGEESLRRGTKRSALAGGCLKRGPWGLSLGCPRAPAQKAALQCHCGPMGCMLRALGPTLPAASGPAFLGLERRADTEFTPTTPNGWALVGRHWFLPCSHHLSPDRSPLSNPRSAGLGYSSTLVPAAQVPQNLPALCPQTPSTLLSARLSLPGHASTTESQAVPRDLQQLSGGKPSPIPPSRVRPQVPTASWDCTDGKTEVEVAIRWPGLDQPQSHGGSCP